MIQQPMHWAMPIALMLPAAALSLNVSHGCLSETLPLNVSQCMQSHLLHSVAATKQSQSSTIPYT